MTDAHKKKLARAILQDFKKENPQVVFENENLVIKFIFNLYWVENKTDGEIHQALLDVFKTHPVVG